MNKPSKKFRVLDLKPTQFAVGMLEVDEKIKQVEKFSEKERRNYVRDNPVPVVISPKGDMYIVDHHHFLVVCLHVGIEKVKVQIVKDLFGRSMTYSAFWKWMSKRDYIYPFCQFGEGPRNPLYLPKDIRGLADDPYRSLAWFVRKDGAVEKGSKNFSEFKWANFFRRHKVLDKNGQDGFERAIRVAKRLTKSKPAERLHREV